MYPKHGTFQWNHFLWVSPDTLFCYSPVWSLVKWTSWNGWCWAANSRHGTSELNTERLHCRLEPIPVIPTTRFRQPLANHWYSFCLSVLRGWACGLSLFDLCVVEASSFVAQACLRPSKPPSHVLGLPVCATTPAFRNLIFKFIFSLLPSIFAPSSFSLLPSRGCQTLSC